ncbi:MAG TPA: site-2 protease family protein [Gaiellaceae bacterium]|nr:site-2 protease family protein [Gaiellaceae bacterium]
MNVLAAILGLGLLVLVHEAGHFFTARAVGMTPRRFYVGFPPPLVRVRRKGIEYGIGMIPLGGYVKIPGMHRPAPSDLDVRGVHFGAAVVEAPRLRPFVDRVRERVAEGDMEGARERLPELETALAAAEISGRARKAAERGLRELKDGLGADAYWRQRAWKRVAVIFAGPGTNLLFAIVLFAALFVVGSGGYRLGFALKENTTVVDEVRADRPAAAMGLRPGDRIIKVNGKDVSRGEDIPPLIRSSGGRPVRLTVRRKNEVIPLGPTRPHAEPELSVFAASWESIRLTGIVTKEIGASLGGLAHGEGRKNVASPVGIVEGSSNALDEGLETFLWVLGLLSLSLALLNLLPLLPLDGGHIVFSIVEGIRGRAVGREVYERVSAVGIALVLLLFFIGLSNDVSRLGAD